VDGEAFDLNSGEVLEHWPVAYALREIIANALDEHVLTGTATPEIEQVGPERWMIRDRGRGLRYQHLTQSENDEKLGHPGVIGKFGFGLNDALAVLDRHGAAVTIRSRHGVITTRVQAKGGFPDVLTLHGVVAPPDEPDMVGTEVIVDGITSRDVDVARDFFLVYRGDAPIDSTRFGEVIPVRDGESAAVYVKGLRVAEEPRFLFSYNITAPDAKLNRALNRERANVGRSAYSDRVKDILKASTSLDVLGPLSADIANFAKGEAMHDELRWKDVALYACRALQSARPSLFVTPPEVADSNVEYARADGLRVVIVPADIARALRDLTDLDGNPMVTLREYRRQREASFSFTYVEAGDLTDVERRVLGLAPAVAALVDFDLSSVDLRISETMRPDAVGGDTNGLWNPADSSITIRRALLADPVDFFGTLLHEIAHALTNFPDRTLEFEHALTQLLGVVSARGLRTPDDARCTS